jgi:4-alpha-glucanotransferase
MKYERSGGILLHPTSLPGPYGIGDIGPIAHEWVDFLSDSGCRLWQVLPLGPTGYGDSPYQCFSAFAGNPYMISPDLLLEDGFLKPVDLDEHPNFPEENVDFGAVISWKLKILNEAYRNFTKSSSAELHQAFESFRRSQAFWLDDYSFFMALKESFGWSSWVNWPAPLRRRDDTALDEARQTNKEAIERHIFQQFIFFRQWGQLKEQANSMGISIIGDIPIFVAHDSAEVWSHPELFFLNEQGNPTIVAGVPPDYFSETGQLWGNPLYRWEVHAENGYSWWLSRFRQVLQLVDIIRLDHFRGFAGYWAVPANEETAVNGKWLPGPGAPFFQVVQDELQDLPIIAEDLGVITPDVVELREEFNLPGMVVLLFAFHGDPHEPFLPHNHLPNRVIYTGTHDNDTVKGWFERVPESEREFWKKYMGRDGSDVAWNMIRAAWRSVGMFALAPMQDFLSLGNEARMNYPGNPSGNWTWRMSRNVFKGDLRKRIAEYNFLYERMNPGNRSPEIEGT